MGTGTLMGHPHLPPKAGWGIAHLQLAPNSVPSLGDLLESTLRMPKREGMGWGTHSPCCPLVPSPSGLAVPMSPTGVLQRPPQAPVTHKQAPQPPVPYLGVPCPFCGSGLIVSPQTWEPPYRGVSPIPYLGVTLSPFVLPQDSSTVHTPLPGGVPYLILGCPLSPTRGCPLPGDVSHPLSERVLPWWGSPLLGGAVRLP